ncbi:uncharacterized protein EV154DRAFT_517322 [Mucor mucedo]|uniref:uncharacterized protein n=1 Tax=Mucor mucedo TaxID=29922 RepID=UPI002220359C|nr:uncharacterized protein EV154DRAFT_517322 [Mucor mucedo]KAI7888537.1 hypothetical protein EV154DRAFT_517322 [Mucor mucedo]
MSLRELKALSRQIRPCHDIMSISRKLRENLTRAKSKMMDSLSKSNAEKDLKIYEYLLMDDLSTISSSVPSSPNLSSASSDYDDDDDDDDNEEDDFSSVTTTESTFQLKLVTSDSGSVSVVPSSSHTPKLPPSHAIMSSPYDTALLPLYTPDFASIDMDFFFPKSTPLTHLHHHHHTTTNTTAASDVTEDQINSWLQRGGFGDSMTPLTMATDQELADLLDFDV